jgi:protein-L-isoaspartate(D-aspartate) O-methyltransferase
MSQNIDDGYYDSQRATMVEEQLQGLGITDERVLAAMGEVPRHRFVPEYLTVLAYQDRALPIGFDQTISQPYMVALMLEALELTGTERVLEVGAGSGYQAALLGLLAREVYAVEIIPGLTESARRVIQRLGYDNVKVILANGSLGFEEAAPYDAIVVAAGAPEVPEALVEQLAEGGRLVIPVGDRSGQTVLRIRKSGGRTHTERITPCIFVPLIGKDGWVRGSGTAPSMGTPS